MCTGILHLPYPIRPAEKSLTSIPKIQERPGVPAAPRFRAKLLPLCASAIRRVLSFLMAEDPLLDKIQRYVNHPFLFHVPGH